LGISFFLLLAETTIAIAALFPLLALLRDPDSDVIMHGFMSLRYGTSVFVVR
jgi:hypothetical protein